MGRPPDAEWPESGSGPKPALFDALSADAIAGALVTRARRRLEGVSDGVLCESLADTVFLERQRLDETRGELSGVEQVYASRIEAAAHSLREARRPEMEVALLQIVDSYAREIHNPFSPRTYRFATRVMPRALTRLLSASRGRDVLLGLSGRGRIDPASRIAIAGPVDQVRELTRRGTVILAPTHVSNLDSPLVGYALYAAGLPPFAYGAGLNLFSNPAMGFFMRRLGAYTVDRRKRNALYKETLKDYSIELLRRRCHSLFFPGGTRSRSGRIESKLKKGLLGTGLAAWQENLGDPLRTGDGDVFVVPCTLSIGVVLEAESLIADALSDEGKQRYIIMDDEFSESRTVATFVRQLLRLDARVHVTFGQPLDVFGNPIDSELRSLDPDGRPIDRRGYVTDRDGTVVVDDQRDHLYTERLARRLCDAYRAGFVVQSTHLAAWAAWEVLRTQNPGVDVYRLVRLSPEQRTVPRSQVEEYIARALRQLGSQPRTGPATPDRILDEALRLFASFHMVRALASEGEGRVIRLGGELTVYYRNRLDVFGLDGGGG
ncbi:MAG: hypothetical protein EXR69_13180 [Myxococcales bacterium]|nr:hypothetical protein [Myxococcales bacterium]